LNRTRKATRFDWLCVEELKGMRQMKTIEEAYAGLADLLGKAVAGRHQMRNKKTGTYRKVDEERIWIIREACSAVGMETGAVNAAVRTAQAAAEIGEFVAKQTAREDARKVLA
jgi:hypothetical protein